MDSVITLRLCAPSQPADDHEVADYANDVAIDLRVPARRRSAASPPPSSAGKADDVAVNVSAAAAAAAAVADRVSSDVETSQERRTSPRTATDDLTTCAPQPEVDDARRHVSAPLPLMVIDETLSALEQDSQPPPTSQHCSPHGRSPMRMLMRDWLVEQTDDRTVPGLEWYDADRSLLKIPWIHASKSVWSRDSHCKLFENWAVYTGKYRPGIDSPNPRRWKANFRCALNSLPDVKEVPDLSKVNGEHGYKIYRFVTPTENSHKINREDGRGRTDWRALNELRSQQQQQQQQQQQRLPQEQLQPPIAVVKEDVNLTKKSKPEGRLVLCLPSSTPERSMAGTKTLDGRISLTFVDLKVFGWAACGGTHTGHVTTTINDEDVQNEIVVATTDDVTKPSISSDGDDSNDSDEGRLQIDCAVEKTENAKEADTDSGWKTNAGAVVIRANSRKRPYGATSRFSTYSGRRKVAFVGPFKDRCLRRWKDDLDREVNQQSPAVVKSDHCYTLLLG